MSVDNNSKLQKTTEYYRRVRECRKEKLDNIFRQLGIFVYSSKKSKAYKSELVDKYRYQKKLQNIEQLENTEEKALKKQIPLQKPSTSVII